MSAIIEQKIRVRNAQNFAADLNTGTYYAFIGNELPWTDENSPDVPTSYLNDIYSLWNNAYGAKNITAGSSYVGVKTVQWTANTVYNQYNPTSQTLFTDAFYVLTSALRVYKCLSNFGGAVTSDEPTQTTSAPFTTSDNYRWKYMYTMTTSVSPLITNAYMPVLEVTGNTAIVGSIESYTVLDGGSGYTAPPNVTIIGDGQDATAVAYVQGGSVTHIECVAAGKNYKNLSSCEVIIDPPSGPGTTASASPNLSPEGGHGANNALELYARFVILNYAFNYDEYGNISVANDFRQVFVVYNPKAYGTTTTATASAYNQTTKITFSSVSPTGFLKDEIVEVANANPNFVKRARVVEYTQTSGSVLSVNNVDIKYNTTDNTAAQFLPNETVVGVSSGATGTIGSIQTPGLEPYSGVLTYYDNRTIITRAPNQIDNVQVVFEF